MSEYPQYPNIVQTITPVGIQDITPIGDQQLYAIGDKRPGDGLIEGLDATGVAPPAYAYVNVPDGDYHQTCPLIADVADEKDGSSLDIIAKAWDTRQQQIDDMSRLRCDLINDDFDRRVTSLNKARNKQLWSEENARRRSSQHFQREKLRAASMISSGHWLWLTSVPCTIS
jgi:hypothetical protein